MHSLKEFVALVVTFCGIGVLISLSPGEKALSELPINWWLVFGIATMVTLGGISLGFWEILKLERR